MLLAAVVGSGIMGDRLAGGNVAIALLANTIATGATLVTLILDVRPCIGGAFQSSRYAGRRLPGGHGLARSAGLYRRSNRRRVAGVAAAHLMFGEPVFFASQHVRAGGAQIFSEFVATFGLLCVIWGCARLALSAVPFAVGAYITAAYWFTASTSFANPAVTLARSASRHLCRHPAGRRSRFYRGTARRRLRRDASFPLAGAVASEGGRRTSSLPMRRRKPPMPDKKTSPYSLHRKLGPEPDGRRPASPRCRRPLRGRERGYEAEPGAAGSDRGDEELGIDISGHRSKSVDEFAGQKFDYVLTVCDNAKESCPIFPGDANRLHRDFEDPALAEGSEAARLAVCRRVRDEMRSYLRTFSRAL